MMKPRETHSLHASYIWNQENSDEYCFVEHKICSFSSNKQFDTFYVYVIVIKIIELVLSIKKKK